MKLQGKDAAHFIAGYYSAMVRLKRRRSANIEDAARTAAEVLTGGTWRGPLVVYEMEEMANRLAQEAAELAKSASP